MTEGDSRTWQRANAASEHNVGESIWSRDSTKKNTEQFAIETATQSRKKMFASLQRALSMQSRNAYHTGSKTMWSFREFRGNSTPVKSNSCVRLKGLEDIPEASGYRNVYLLYVKGYKDRIHEMQHLNRQSLGPIWRESLGSGSNVHIASGELIKQVLRQEGHQPVRADMELWKKYRRIHGLAEGPSTADGENWCHLRSILNPGLLLPSQVVKYERELHPVISDLLERINWLRFLSPNQNMVNNINKELQNFTMEGIFAALFSQRLGCLSKKTPQDTQQFIDSIHTMMRSFIWLSILPTWTRPLLPFWKSFVGAWDIIFAFVQKHIEKKIKEVEQIVASGEPVPNGYVTRLLTSGKLSRHEIYSSITEIVLGGVDTTAVANEVENASPGKGIPGVQNVTCMPLLRAVVKETLRLYPVVPVNSRFALEDMVVGGYLIPKGNLITLCTFVASRDPEEFPEPTSFKPERWLRTGPRLHHPYASLPFGYGVRACIGRRLAELEVHLTLARLMKQFILEPDYNEKPPNGKMHLILLPDRPINLRFMDRKPCQ
uniref:sterol 26-hydroxylase, mitochondrial-like isoform X2 n=1 Tax=Myxine glutinosa TaxID=7769 RepID=UPI00358E377C